MLTFKLVILKMQHFKKIVKFDAQIMIRREKRKKIIKKRFWKHTETLIMITINIIEKI
jgi:hypothetical protein